MPRFLVAFVLCCGQVPASVTKTSDAEPSATKPAAFDPTAETAASLSKMQVRPDDWPQWGGSYFRNNTPRGSGIPIDWDAKTRRNIKWSTKLGSQSYGNPVIANGKIYVGTNNGAGYIQRYPSDTDLGVLLCLDEATGKFLWQHSNEKLSTGRVHDWPTQGICSTPCVDAERLWYVTNRGEVVCLDTEGFYDGENDGPFTAERPLPAAPAKSDKTGAAGWDEIHEADVIWKFNMMRTLGVSQHNMCSCSLTFVGDVLFCITSNGVGEAHNDFPSPDAPSLIALDRRDGRLLWTDSSPGANVLHGQWSSPAYGVFEGVPQVLFGAGDGWLYSFDPAGDGSGKSKMLWKFDCNPKESKYVLSGQATRNHLIATPVVYDGAIYIAVGEDPEHNQGVGHLWCIDPTKRGDVSTELVYNAKDPQRPIPHKRLQACEPAKGDFTKPNPNSAALWHYASFDRNKDGKLEHEEVMHRTMGTVAIKHDLLFVADFSGVVHCVNAKTGIPYWTHDLLAESWSSPLIVDGHVYIGSTDGTLTIFELAKTLNVVAAIDMGVPLFTTAVIARNVLYIAGNNELFAIESASRNQASANAE